jgi:hypothetical protein
MCARISDPDPHVSVDETVPISPKGGSANRSVLLRESLSLLVAYVRDRSKGVWRGTSGRTAW